MMPKIKINLYKGLRYIGLSLGLSLFGLQLITSIVKFKATGEHSINWFYIILALMVMIFIYFIQVRLWLSSMRSVGSHITTRDAIKGYWISFIPRYIPGSVWGYLGRNDWLSRDFAIPEGITNVGSLVEVFFILVGGLVIIISTTAINSLLLGKLVVSVAILVFSGLILKRVSGWPIFLNSRNRGNILTIPKDGFQVNHWFAGITYSIVNWILYGLVLFLCLFPVMPLIPQPLWYLLIQLVNVFAISWLVGFLIIIVPGGLGIREFVLSALLQVLSV